MAYTRINWENQPSENTPISAENLNIMDLAIDTLDSRLTTAESDIDNLETGWVSAPETLTFSSWNATTKTGVVTTATDLRTKYCLGMKLKFTQTTVKFGIITAITSNSITIFMGGNYTLVDAIISNVYFSTGDIPYGFPKGTDLNNFNYTISSDLETATFRKQGNIVTVSGWFIINGATKTFTLPYAPASRLFTSSVGLNPSLAPTALGTLDLRTDGTMIATYASAVTYAATGFAYYTNA